MNIRPILRFGARVASVRRKLIFECETGDTRAEAAAVPLRFRYGGVGDLRVLAASEYSYDPAARAFGLDRIRAGDRLVLGESDGRVVFYAWVMYGQMDMGLDERVPLSSDRAYTYKLFTVADCRGRRICPAYYTWIKQELRAQGYRRLLAWVETGNEASIRAHTRAGFQVVGCIWHLRFLFRSFPLLKPAVRRSLADGLVPSLA